MKPMEQQRKRGALRAPGGPLLGLGSAWQIVLVLAVLAAGVAAALSLNTYYVYVLANVALLAVVGVGLNVLIGLTGQVSFGHVGFYAICLLYTSPSPRD